MIRLPFAAVVAVLLAASAVGQTTAPPVVPPLASFPPGPPLAPSKGDLIPVFETMGIDGKAHRVDFPKGSKTVLLFFMSSCPHCHKMIPEWNRAYERKPKDLKVTGVIMDQEPPGFWGTVSVVFPVVRSPGREFLNNLNVRRAPLAVRVAAGGRIEDLIVGETDPIRLGEIFKP
jgi:thiol-disulfide isomerase/thioredoxin